MAKKEHKELPIPDTSLAAGRAIEVLRVWINKDGSMDATCMPAFKDPGMWGILLVDIARYVGKNYSKELKADEEQVLLAIRNVMMEAWNKRIADRSFPQPN